MEQTEEPNDNFDMLRNKRLLLEVFLLTLACGLLSGGLYFYRTNFLELSSFEDNLFRAVRMTVIYLAIPLTFFLKFRRFDPVDLGITKKNLILSVLLGTGVFSIALVIFLSLIGVPEFDRYFMWSQEMENGEFAITMILIAWMAALTDIWTRGMVLMPVMKLHGVYLALLTQNVVWLAAHLYELEFLRGSMTLLGAVGLTITLGILGDLVVIRTKNVIGPAVGHIMLNLVFFSYIRII